MQVKIKTLNVIRTSSKALTFTIKKQTKKKTEFYLRLHHISNVIAQLAKVEIPVVGI